MKFECKACVKPCELEIGDCEQARPLVCPLDIDTPVWRKVTAPTAPPKLTVEALAERGIEWPEWATFAGVHALGKLMFFEKRPRLNTSIGGWDYYGFNPVPKMSDANVYFDYSDWMNSLIMRPENTELPDENRFALNGVEYEAVAVESGHCSCCDISSVCPNVNHPPCANGRRDKQTVYFRKVKQSPAWLKLGNYAKCGEVIGKIDWISRDSSEVRLNFGDTQFFKVAECKPVTWRAWTFEEAELQVGEAFRFKKTGYIGVMLGYHKDRGAAFPASGEHHNVYFSSLDELFEQGEQLNGLPCGAPVVGE